MEDNDNKEAYKKHNYVRPLGDDGTIAIYWLFIKIVFTIFPDLMDKLSTSKSVTLQSVAFITSGLIQPIFYSFICGLWFFSAVIYYRENYEYGVFKRSVLKMAVCLALFWGLDTGFFRMIVIYFINAFSY